MISILVGQGIAPFCFGHSCGPLLSWEKRESVERRERHWPVVSISSQHHLQLLPMTIMAILLLGGEGISGHPALQFPSGSWIAAVWVLGKQACQIFMFLSGACRSVMLLNLLLPQAFPASRKILNMWSKSVHWQGSRLRVACCRDNLESVPVFKKGLSRRCQVFINALQSWSCKALHFI